MSKAEDAFIEAWEADPLPGADLRREYKFHPTRQWRFDIAFPSIQAAIEIEGRGRHQTVVGFRNDCEKYNTAASMGWTLYRFPASDVTRNPAAIIEQVKEWLCL